MDALYQGWFTELNDLWPGMAASLEVEKILHKEKSLYQDILVIQTKNHGKALVLDGIIQCTEHDEFAYHEMIAFLPLCSHPCPKSVLIIGGGDGGVAREVAKYSTVEKIVQVEIDESVLKVSRTYFNLMASGLDNPKVTLKVGDGFEFMKEHSHEFDVIITDSCDPVGPAECLFQETYFKLMCTALKPNGVICSQAGTAWANINHVVQTRNNCRSAFPIVEYAIASVPTYPTGQIGFVLGSTNPSTNFKEPLRTFTEEELDKMELYYYNDRVHRAAFAMPRFIEKELQFKA